MQLTKEQENAIYAAFISAAQFIIVVDQISDQGIYATGRLPYRPMHVYIAGGREHVITHLPL